MSTFRALLATASVLAGTPAVTASTFGQDDYNFVILESFLGTLASDASEPTINDAGTVLYYDRNRLSTTTADPEYVAVSIHGTEINRISPSSGRFMIGGAINASGQIVAELFDDNSSIADRSLILIDPDGTVTELMRISPTGTPGATIRLLAEVRINASGEVAFSGTGPDGERWVGKVAPGVEPIILDREVSGLGGRTVTSVVGITDDGVVSWFAQDQGERGAILASDGQSPPQVLLFSDDPLRSLNPQHATNNAGQVLGLVSGFADPTVVLGDGFDLPSYDPEGFADVQTFLDNDSQFVEGLDINDFGQFLARDGSDGSIYLNGERLIGAGDLLGIGELIPLGSGGEPTRIVNGAALNNLGQAVFEAASSIRGSTPGTIAGTETIVVRIDPRGATPDHPVLPIATTGDVNAISLNLINDLGITAPIYVDPALASSFLYALAPGMPNFMSLVIPAQDLGGDDLFEVSFEGFLVSLGFGEVLDFASYLPGGVSTFSILGIGPEAGRTTDDPFVVGLTFASRGRVDFTITGQPEVPVGPTPVPLPAGGYLLLASMLGLGLYRRRKLPTDV